MKLVRDLDVATSPSLPTSDLSAETGQQRSLQGGAIAIGNFDGVHRGHARLIERLIANARAVGGPAIVFTFDPHPVRLLRPEAVPPPLTWTDRKAELLANLGVDAMIAYPTNESLLALSPREFFDQIVRQRLDARAMVEGPNFFFGKDRAGDVKTLRQFCTKANITLEVVEPMIEGDAFVSSSRIRECVGSGDVDVARQMLTEPYRVRGMVTHGAGRGSGIGFPTANLEGIDTLTPALGVYAGRAVVRGQVNEGETSETIWPAAINLGPNPTFGERAVKFETHLIGFERSLYGQILEVDFLSRLRDIRPFDSTDDLKRQLRQDVEATVELNDQLIIGQL